MRSDIALIVSGDEEERVEKLLRGRRTFPPVAETFSGKKTHYGDSN